MKKMIVTAVLLALIAALVIALEEGETYEQSEYVFDIYFHEKKVNK